VVLEEVLAEHEGYPITPGRLTPATTPFVVTSKIPNPRTKTPTISDSIRIAENPTRITNIDLPKARTCLGEHPGFSTSAVRARTACWRRRWRTLFSRTVPEQAVLSGLG
jgi:hypothetical protein